MERTSDKPKPRIIHGGKTVFINGVEVPVKSGLTSADFTCVSDCNSPIGPHTGRK